MSGYTVHCIAPQAQLGVGSEDVFLSVVFTIFFNRKLNTI